jgi:hypothetical protein
MTGLDGLISPTLLPPSTPGTTVLLETNSTPNAIQTILNLKQGANITLTADAFGGVTIAGSGVISSSFTDITSGDNITADMIVDTGATLSYANSGVVNANEIGTINVNGNLPTHAGEILISQPGNETAVWADPLVQGIQADGTTASTINPVLISGRGPDGNQHDIATDDSGNIIFPGFISVNNFPTVLYGSPAQEALNCYVVNEIAFAGSVEVTNFPSVQVVSGTVAVAPLSAVGEPPASASVGMSSAMILASNPLRKGCSIQNTGSDVISLAFGASAAVLYSGTVLYPGSTFYMDSQDFTTQQINAIASDSSGSVSIQEYE